MSCKEEAPNLIFLLVQLAHLNGRQITICDGMEIKSFQF